jgi:hypothetical protein
MNDFERELREAFQRREPPPGFADRVMARIPHQMPQPKPRPVWRREWMALAAAACLAVVGGGAYEQHKRQVEGEKAKQELIYALTVATQSLEFTKSIITR